MSRTHRVTRSGEIRAITAHRRDDGTYVLQLSIRLDDGPDAGRTVLVDIPGHRGRDTAETMLGQAVYVEQLNVDRRAMG